MGYLYQGVFKRFLLACVGLCLFLVWGVSALAWAQPQRQVRFGQEYSLTNLAVKKEMGFQEGSFRSLTIHIDKGKARLYKKEGYDLLEVDGLTLRTVAGEPMVPFKVISLKFKGKVRILGVKVVGGKYSEILNRLSIAPAPPPYKWKGLGAWNKLPPLSPKLEVYGSKDYYPGKLVSYDVGRDNDYTYVYVKIYPIQYAPALMKAILVHDLTITLYYEEIPSSRASKSWARPKADASAQAVIITSADLATQAQALADFHTQKGINTVVVTLDDIRNNYSPASDPPFPGYKDNNLPEKNKITNYDYDLAKRIINFLRSAPNQYPNLKYVVILGAASMVPPSYYYFDQEYYQSSNENTTYNAWVPTDLLYMSPDYDFVPNYALGRIPVRNQDEANAYLNYLNSYYQSLDYSWFKNFGLLGGQPFNSIRLVGEMVEAYVANQYLDGFNIIKYFETDHAFNSQSFDFNNKGFIYHIGHGSGGSWGLEGNDALKVEDMREVPNNPVVVSVACMNGAFDTRLFPNDLYPPDFQQRDTSFGEGVVLKGSGIAYIGATRENFGSLVYHLNFGRVVPDKFTQGIALMTYAVDEYRNTNVLGEMVKRAYNDYLAINTLDEDISKRSLFEFTLLGDPALQLLPRPPGYFHEPPGVVAKNAIKYQGEMPIFRTGAGVTIQKSGGSSVKLVEFMPQLTAQMVTQINPQSPVFLVRVIDDDTGKEDWLYGRLAYPNLLQKRVQVTDNQGHTTHMPFLFVGNDNLDTLVPLGPGFNPYYREGLLAFDWLDQNQVGMSLGLHSIYISDLAGAAKITSNEVEVRNNQIVGWTSCEDPSISPDGRYVAFIEEYTFIQNQGGENTGQTLMHLHYVDLAQPNPNAPTGMEVPNSNPSQLDFPLDVDWLPNGKIVYSVGNVGDAYGSQGYPSGIYSIYPDGRERTGIVVQTQDQFPMFDNQYIYSYVFYHVAVSPSGNKVAYVLQVLRGRGDSLYVDNFTLLMVVNSDGSDSPGRIIYQDVVSGYLTSQNPDYNLQMPTIISPAFLDDNTIAFLKVRWPESGTPPTVNDIVSSQLLTVSVNGGDANQMGQDFQGFFHSFIDRVVSPPTADFNFNVNQGTVAFTDGSTGDIRERLWFFGDGEVSNDPSPTHQYKRSGTYNVTLVVTENDTESSSVTKTVSVNVPAQPPVVDSFTANPTSGTAPLTVAFSCVGHDPDGQVVEYRFDFDGDGVADETGNTTGQTAHVYNDPGVYRATCTVVDDGGLTATSNAVEINVGGAPGGYTLTVSKTGTGSGTVISSPGGINCGGTCSAQFDAGEVVTLMAIADAGSTFGGWGGDCGQCGSSTTCQVTMDGNKSCTAEFDQQGGGNQPPVVDSFTASPTSGTAPLTVAFSCVGHDPDGQVVEYRFDFDGDGVADETGNTTGQTAHVYNDPGVYRATCTVVDDGGLTATSNAVEINVGGAPGGYTLTVSKTGTGSGTVISSPGGINCGGTCSAQFDAGEVVTLMAIADAGSTFGGWGGDCGQCGSSTTCQVTMDGNKSCTAEFDQQGGSVATIEYVINNTHFRGGPVSDPNNSLQLAFIKPSSLNQLVDLYISLRQPSSTGGTATYYFVYSPQKVTLPNGIYFNYAVPVQVRQPYLSNSIMPQTLQLYGPVITNPIFNDGWVVPAPILCPDLPDGNYTFTVEAYSPGTSNLLARGTVTIVLERGCQ